MHSISTAFLHYSAPPVVGGVEAVMLAQARAFLSAGYPVTLIAGRGDANALPAGVDLIRLPELDSQNPDIEMLSGTLERGEVPAGFDAMVENIAARLRPVVARFDTLIVHNVMSKHFNLPLTAALFRLIDAGAIRRCIAWCHDFTWTSPHSRSKVFPGYPWDLLRTFDPRVTYVVVSEQRKNEVSAMLGWPRDSIHVIYNGVDPADVLGLSAEGLRLAQKMDLFTAGLILLMPVRVTQAKNIEFALEVAAELKSRGCRPRLIVTGPPDPHEAGALIYFRSLQGLRDRLGVAGEAFFVAELGERPADLHTINAAVVGELYRLADIVFMPSHREGFGIPVLEAGLAGIPVISAAIPAAVEIGQGDVDLIPAKASAADAAGQVLSRINEDGAGRLKRRVRRNYTWEAIFREKIEPLLSPGAS